MFQQLVQIVHVSDMHLRKSALRRPSYCDWLYGWAHYCFSQTRKLPSRTPKRLQALQFFKSLCQGLQPDLPLSSTLFHDFMQTQFHTSPLWDGPTWVLMTGDLSAFGDVASVDAARTFVRTLLPTADCIFDLYGNHDAWPGDHPRGSTATAVKETGRQLRARHYPDSYPRAPLAYDSGLARVELYALNSVIHDIRNNSMAVGTVREDPLWHLTDSNKGAHQLDVLTRLANASADETVPTVRLVALHHPVDYPSEAPWDRIFNLDEFEGWIRSPETPQFHVFLSGHTHSLFPRMGDLTQWALVRSKSIFSDKELQLVAGTLSQQTVSDMSFEGEPASEPWPYQAQLLRLYWSTDERLFILERNLIGLSFSDGAYRVRASERIVLP